MNIINVYTDGSCSKNGDPNATAGYGIHFPNKELKDISKSFNYPPFSSNRAELYAIYKALKKITKNIKFDKIHIHSDSAYSINCVTKWHIKWIKNNWHTSKKQPVKNMDIIKPICNLMKKYPKNIIITHISRKFNDKADQLAKKGAKLL